MNLGWTLISKARRFQAFDHVGLVGRAAVGQEGGDVGKVQAGPLLAHQIQKVPRVTLLAKVGGGSGAVQAVIERMALHAAQPRQGRIIVPGHEGGHRHVFPIPGRVQGVELAGPVQIAVGSLMITGMGMQAGAMGQDIGMAGM
mgnify:CR=1 FL=1